MDEYAEFRSFYKEYFLKDQTFCISQMITCIEDIPATHNCLNVVRRAYRLLNVSSERELQKMEMLNSYSQLMEMNRNGGMKTSGKEFALILYILHYFTLRILRSPWRKDYLSIKTYNGFHHHILNNYLHPRVLEKLMQYLGFQYNSLHTSYEYEEVKLGRASTRRIFECGIDLFLSYTHCRMLYDPHFFESMKKMSESSRIVPGVHAPSVQSTSSSSSRIMMQRGQELPWNREDGGTLYGGKQYNSLKLATNSHQSNGGLNEEHSFPLDLHVPVNTPPHPTPQYFRGGSPYSHRKFMPIVKKSTYESHIIPSTHNQPSQSGQTTQERSGHATTQSIFYEENSNPLSQLSLENSVNGHVLYPPNIPQNSRLANGNYVQFVPSPSALRGSPDGEINEETCHNQSKEIHFTKHNHASKSSRRNVRPENRHVYHEISDKDLY